jgi:hypothetical protein
LNHLLCDNRPARNGRADFLPAGGKFYLPDRIFIRRRGRGVLNFFQDG